MVGVVEEPKVWKLVFVLFSPNGKTDFSALQGPLHRKKDHTYTFRSIELALTLSTSIL